MSPMMLREMARAMAVPLHLRRVFPVMHDRLNALVVLSYAVSHELAVPEIIADAIPRKNFRCHQP